MRPPHASSRGGKCATWKDEPQVERDSTLTVGSKEQYSGAYNIEYHHHPRAVTCAAWKVMYSIYPPTPPVTSNPLQLTLTLGVIAGDYAVYHAPWYEIPFPAKTRHLLLQKRPAYLRKATIMKCKWSIQYLVSQGGGCIGGGREGRSKACVKNMYSCNINGLGYQQ